ncbi:hypothetical protein KCP77_08965 [Salmonella enterica subsp. enterica]|nr:hypothetical protein KCP77_08965 [Salmonella enterica subsp. enterica]
MPPPLARRNTRQLLMLKRPSSAAVLLLAHSGLAFLKFSGWLVSHNADAISGYT